MATILEMLLSTMTAEEQAVIRANIAKNPQILVDDAQAGNLLSIYKNESGDPTPSPTPTPTPTPSPTAHVPTVPVTAAAPTPAPTPTPAPAADASAQILAKLTSIESSIDTKIADLKKSVVTRDQLPTLEGAFIASAARINDEINQLRTRHKSELGEDFDQAKFEKFLEDANIVTKDAAGNITSSRPGFPSLTKAWEAMTAETRTKKAIDKGIEEGVRTRTSGSSVPGQTTSVALSPAQAVMAKARAAASGETKSAAVAAADKLAALVRARDGEGAGV